MASEGYAQRVDGEMRRLAWHAANIMNVWIPKGKRVTPGDLLGEQRPPTPADPEEFRAMMRERMRARRDHG